MAEYTISWQEAIHSEMANNNDTGPIISCTLTEQELDVRFDPSYGGTNGKPFTAWTSSHVYFPICYDGAEWCGSAPRHPCAEALNHQGGG